MPDSMKNQLSVVLLILLSHFCGAQHYPSHHYTLREGLPSNSIKSLFLDSRDILWVGTDAGLSIYHENQIHRVSLPDTLLSKRIWAIAEDSSGHLWLGTYGGGLLRYDGRDFSLITTPQLPSDLIRVLYYSQRHNSLMAGTQSGFSQITPNEIFSWVPEELAGQRFLVMGFLETHNGIIFHTFSHGAFHFDPETKEVTPLSAESPLQVRSSSATFISSRGDTLVGLFKNGLRIVNADGVRDFKDLGQVFHISEDRHGILWISVWSYFDMQEPGGLYTYDGHTLRHVGPQWNVKDRMAWATLPDPATGTVFVATDGEGLYKLIDRGISYFTAQHFGTTRLEIYDLTIHSGKLWITAADRVIHGNPPEPFQVLPEAFFARQGIYPRHRTDSAVFNPPGRFLGLHTDTENNLWLGSVNALFKLSDPTPRFQRFNVGKRFGENFIIFPDGKAISGSWGHFREASNIILSDNYIYFQNQTDYPADVNRIVERNDEWWFSSFTRGLYRYKQGRFRKYSTLQPELPVNISSLAAHGPDCLVAGTHNGLIYFLTGSDTLHIQHIVSPADGLKGDEVLWLLADTQNRLWAGTDMGINIIDLDSLYRYNRKSIRFINESEGLPDFAIRSALQDPEGILWLGGKEHLIRIDPYKLLLQPDSQGQVVLTHLLLNFRETNWERPDSPDSWHNVPAGQAVLNHRANNLTFRFTVPNLLNPDKVEYRYFLKGFSQEHASLGTRSEITFTNLDPGRYTLQVDAHNIQTGLSYLPLQVSFRIRPPWYRTWYFYGALAVLTLALILLVMKLRILRVQKMERLKLEHEKKLNTMRIQAIQAQMNPHFVFNVLSSIQNFMLDNDMDSTLEYLNDFSALIRKTMENISEESILLSDEIAYLKRYIKLENLRLGNTMRSVLCIDPLLLEQNLRLPPMIIQPFVENAIKHGLAPKTGQRVLLLTFRWHEKQLIIHISDNGVGLDTAPGSRIITPPHRPAGISNTTQRINHYIQNHSPDQPFHPAMGVTLQNRTRNGSIAGVTVRIILPAPSRE